MTLQTESSKKSEIARSSRRLIRQNPAGTVGAFVVLIILLGAIFAPFITPFDYETFARSRYTKPMGNAMDGSLMLLGSDNLGRDQFTRLLYGARISLLVGFVSPIIGVAIGSLLGIVSAYYGKWTDLLLQRLTDTLLILPGLVILMTVTASFGFTITVVLLALALFSMIGTIRVVRSHVLGLRGAQFIDAQRAIGSSDLRVIFIHLLPNTLPVAVVLVAVGIAGAIVAEAQLSFLGLGIAPPVPTWGNMLNGAQSRFDLGPHLAIWPGIFISVTVLGLNLVGDAVRDIMDPRLRGRQ
ncbi:MAG: ABC transporter permease [SAR202 cluster bacterium]|nr:MAG: ABC transporter permease [SAR202 cluster bacterium]